MFLCPLGIHSQISEHIAAAIIKIGFFWLWKFFSIKLRWILHYIFNSNNFKIYRLHCNLSNVSGINLIRLNEDLFEWIFLWFLIWMIKHFNASKMTECKKNRTCFKFDFPKLGLLKNFIFLFWLGLKNSFKFKLQHNLNAKNFEFFQI